MDKFKFDEEHEKMFQMIRENNIRAKMENIQNVSANDYKVQRDKNIKDRIKNMLLCGTLAVTVVASTAYGFNSGVNHLKNEKMLNEANKYMNTAINFVCPDVERGVLADGSIVLLDDSSQAYYELCEELQNKYNMSRDCAIYAIAKQYGDDAFDKVVKHYGYNDKDDFLYELYALPTSLSSSGDTVYTKAPSFKVFENNVQVEYVNKVNDVKKLMEQKVIESKGITK